MIYGKEKIGTKTIACSYDRKEREASCSKCKKVIGEQVRYLGFDEEKFHFGNEKENYTRCPYCGHKFKK